MALPPSLPILLRFSPYREPRLRSIIDSFCDMIWKIELAQRGVNAFWERSTQTRDLLNAIAPANLSSPWSHSVFCPSNKWETSISWLRSQVAMSLAEFWPTNILVRFNRRLMHFSWQLSWNFLNYRSLAMILRSLHRASNNSAIWSSSKTFLFLSS